LSVAGHVRRFGLVSVISDLPLTGDVERY